MTESYRRWRLPDLWQMLAADNPTDAHLHLATLRRQQTALETQRDRLRTLRDQLTEAWPPEKSEAAMAFVQQVNDMIRAMSLTVGGAADVRTNLSLIIDAISQAKAQLAPLVDQYQQAAKVPDHRVGEHARKLLDERARRILVGTDAAVTEPAAALDVALPTYQRISLQTEIPTPSVPAGEPGPGGSTGRGSGRSALSSLPPPRFDPPESTADLAEDEKVLLAASGSTGDVGRNATLFQPAGTDGVRSAVNAMSAPPFSPGRVLGADPRSWPSGLNGTGTVVGPQGRGVIGTSGGIPGGVRSGVTTGAHGTTARAPGGYRDASFEEYANRRRAARGDLDESWPVPRGVSPVIEPPVIPPHDPGPGVLGIDR